MTNNKFKHNVREAKDNAELTRCFPIMCQLRPQYTLDSFVQRVTEQQAEGYRLAYLEVDSKVVSAAGFRVINNLAWGKFLYVDDLVTDENHRSLNYGSELLNWLINEARRLKCGQLHLDSGVQRIDAHRFYAREGMLKSCYHYSFNL